MQNDHYEEYILLRKEQKNSREATYFDNLDRCFESFMTFIFEGQYKQVFKELFKKKQVAIETLFNVGEKFMSGCLELDSSNNDYFEQQIITRLNKLTDIPADKIWMLLIDGKDLCFGKNCYDDGTGSNKISEPGYLRAGMHAFYRVNDTINDEITLESLIDIHARSLMGVHTRDGTYVTNNKLELASGGRMPFGGSESRALNVKSLKETKTYDFVDLFVFDAENKLHYLSQ